MRMLRFLRESNKILLCDKDRCLVFSKIKGFFMKYLKYALLSVSFLVAYPVIGQDHHYWGNQFGSRAALMSGAVVGGVRDTSAGFYNPGALGFTGTNTFSVSANAYSIERVSIDNGAGTNMSLNSSEMNIAPLLIAGTLSFDSLPQDVFSYSLLTKTLSSIKASARRERNTDIIPAMGDTFVGNEDYVGQYLLDSHVKEMWGGLSWARKLDDHFSVGVTGFLAMRTQNQNQSSTAFAVNGFHTARSAELLNIDFWNIRSLLKFGLAADFDALKLGLTLTTPSINVKGKGTIAGESSSNNVAIEEGTNLDLAGTDRQEDLEVTYKSPLSVAAGFEYNFNQGKTTIAGTVEWFAQQDIYDVIVPNHHIFLHGFGKNTLYSDETLKTVDAATSVTNFALALEHAFNEKMKGYISMRTDYANRNAEVDKNGISLGISDWDIYHVTLGTTYKRKRSELAIGLTYSFGNQDNFTQLDNLSGRLIDPDNDILLSGEPRKTTANYTNLSLIIGYTYFFDE